MTVYLLHIEPPFKHAKHYTGYTPDLAPDRRVKEHMDGRGSPLVAAALAAGCVVSLAAHWPGGRDFESWLKACRKPRRWCPCCGGDPAKVHPGKLTDAFRSRKRDW